MRKTTPTREFLKQNGLGFLVLSGIFGSVYGWITQQIWYGEANLIFPLLTLTGLSATLSQAFAGIFKPASAYRAAVLASVGVAVGCWVWPAAESSGRLEPPELALTLCAGLLGSMAASWVKLGFSDETFIPPVETTREIRSQYLQAFPHPPRIPSAKRAFDVLVSLTGITLSAPLWLLIGITIWLQDPGPILFVKHCTGFQGKPFQLYKFRTMKTNAESKTGPVSAGKRDGRVLRGCKILRQTALDELPQLVNILTGEMSFVGPRPLRSVVEIENLLQIPGYAQRFNTLPGLAGLAQVCGSSQTPARNKLRYEILYAQNASLLLDIKLISIACLLVFNLRWKKDWDGRIPRAWLRAGNKFFKESSRVKT
jgi:lipopolysaccharide/colanic/teichoic acid biosynthesis glycosyltransferase